MAAMLRRTTFALAPLLAAPAAFAADQMPRHRIAMHVDENNPQKMNLTLNNVVNLSEYYRERNESAQIEVVAYGPGLNMLRADTSPVKDRLKRMKELAFPATLVFSACNNTRQAMEKAEGHPIAILPEARIVPAGVVRLVELQEQHWSYIRP